MTSNIVFSFPILAGFDCIAVGSKDPNLPLPSFLPSFLVMIHILEKFDDIAVG